ncbi:MAG TPA: hypothetical protein VF929_05680 [Gemmatimonadaceae bacterium]
MSGRALHIRLKRHADGSASITCTRGDGTVTWQRQKGQLGAVFPPHDLTHYAVETTLGCRSAFYGLMADGWEIGDFAAPWPRGELSEEAREVELFVGCLDTERRQLTRWTAEELNAHARVAVSASRFSGLRHRELTDDQLQAIRALRDDLLRRWHALSAGESLELMFEHSS